MGEEVKEECFDMKLENATEEQLKFIIRALVAANKVSESIVIQTIKLSEDLGIFS